MPQRVCNTAPHIVEAIRASAFPPANPDKTDASADSSPQSPHQSFRATEYCPFPKSSPEFAAQRGAQRILSSLADSSKNAEPRKTIASAAKLLKLCFFDQALRAWPVHPRNHRTQRSQFLHDSL